MTAMLNGGHWKASRGIDARAHALWPHVMRQDPGKMNL